MAQSDQQLAQNLKRLDDLNGYGVEDGDLDPRGWTVVTTDGRMVGTVEDLIVDTSTMKVRYFEIDVDDATSGDDHLMADAVSARVDEDGRQIIVDAGTYGAAHASAGAATDTNRSRSADTAPTRAAETDATRLTRSEEELRIGKREVSRGEARVGKRVETEHVREPVSVRREEVVIERRPVSEGASATASISEGEIRVPLVEEEVIVEKRPVVKEELVIGKRVVEETEVVETDLRKERFELEGDEAVSADPDAGRTSSGGRKNR